MNDKKISLSTERVLEKMGLRIKKARLRRNINAEALAEESGISRGTLAAIEKGSKSVSIGAYAAVLQVLEMEKDLELIAVDVDGKNIKVGDPVQINSTLAANKVLSAADMGSYKYFQNLNSKGAVIWTSDKGPGQTFTFLAEGNNRYLLVMMYAPMYAMHFDKGDYVNQSSYPNARNCKLYNVSAKHEAFKFLIEKTGNGYSFVSLAGSNIKALYLDVFGGKTDNGSKVIGWDTKNSNASQVWTFTIRHSTTTIGYE